MITLFYCKNYRMVGCNAQLHRHVGLLRLPNRNESLLT